MIVAEQSTSTLLFGQKLYSSNVVSPSVDTGFPGVMLISEFGFLMNLPIDLTREGDHK
jgi:hypothetical protein